MRLTDQLERIPTLEAKLLWVKGLSLEEMRRLKAEQDVQHAVHVRAMLLAVGYPDTLRKAVWN